MNKFRNFPGRYSSGNRIVLRSSIFSKQKKPNPKGAVRQVTSSIGKILSTPFRAIQTVVCVTRAGSLIPAEKGSGFRLFWIRFYPP